MSQNISAYVTETGFETTTETLTTVGKRAREYTRDTYGSVMNNCWAVSTAIMDFLQDDHGLPTELEDVSYGVRCVYVDGTKHYIFVISGRLVSGFHPDTEVWVDGAIDQFCDENVAMDSVLINSSVGSVDELDAVRVLRADDYRRSEYTIHDTIGSRGGLL